jgi:hypothetical protein
MSDEKESTLVISCEKILDEVRRFVRTNNWGYKDFVSVEKIHLWIKIYFV